MTIPSNLIARWVWDWHGFSVLVASRFLSIFAAGLFNVTLLWLVIDAAENVESIALVLTLRLLPFIIFGLFGGWLGDNLDRRLIIVFADIGRATIMAGCVVSLLSGANTIVVLGISGFLLTTTRSISSPAIVSIVPQLCKSSHLHRAMAIFVAIGYVVGVIAPVAGGIALANLPQINVLILIAALFAGAATISLALPPCARKGRARTPFVSDYGVLLTFLFRRRSSFFICMVLNTLAIIAVSGAETKILPIRVNSLFPDNPAFFGAILSTMALCALLGAVTTGLMRSWPQQATLYAAWVVYGLSLASFALLERQSTILLAAVALGYSGAIVDTLLMVMMQRAVSGRHRAKLLGLMSIVFNFGDVTSLWMTALVASAFGYPAVFLLAAAITLFIAGSGLWLTRQEVARASP